MDNSEKDKIQAIIDKIAESQYTDIDLENLRQLLENLRQLLIASGRERIIVGENIIGKIEGGEIQIGDRIYQQWDEEAIAALVKAIQQVTWQCVASFTENDYTQVQINKTGIGIIDEVSKGIGELSKLMTDLSQQHVMRYGLKLAFSPNPNQEYFISGGDQIIKRWQKQIKTWEIKQEINVPGISDLWFTSVAISPDGQHIAGCKGYHIMIWRLGEEQALHTFGKTILKNPLDLFGFDSISFSPNGKILAANDNKDIKLRDVESGKEIATLSGHADQVTCVAFNPKNVRIMASCSYDKSIKLWDIDSQRCLGTLSAPQAHKDAVYTLAFSPDGKIMASGSKDNSIKLWNIYAGEMPETLGQHSDAVTCLVFSPDGKTLVSGSNDGTIVEWDILEKESQTFPQQHLRGVTSIAMSPDGETLISGGRDQTIKVWRRSKSKVTQ